MHLFDDLPPADARVVCAERNFAFLRAVRDHAHFGAAEIVIEQVLEPHSLDTQHAPNDRRPFSRPSFGRCGRELDVVDDGLNRLTICEIGNPSGAVAAS